MGESGAVAVAVDGERADAVREAVLAGLQAFNRAHAPPPGFSPLTVSARDRAGRVVGGLVGQTGWTWLYVDLLWVAEPQRRRGVGRRLLRVAEQAAAVRGCRHAYLDTFDFQARPFYEGEGYTVFGVQDDYPPGHQRFFLRKEIAPARAEEGA